MATVTIARSDLFPVGTTVGIYPAGAFPPANQVPSAPGAAAIASAAVAANGTLTVTDAGILSYTRYVAAANVGGTWVYARCRSTLDAFDYGRALGTGDTVSGSTALANVVATSGAFAVGQRISGPGIPGGTFLRAGSGASWTMTAPRRHRGAHARGAVADQLAVHREALPGGGASPRRPVHVESREHAAPRRDRGASARLHRRRRGPDDGSPGGQ
jgi:hypothetical protein